MRPRTAVMRSAMDGTTEAGDEGAMSLSSDAKKLWHAALALNRAAAAVSPRIAGLPPLLFFTDPLRTPRPWETAGRLPAGAVVVYRHFGAPNAAETAARMRDVTREAGVRLLIGLDEVLAEAASADGVHLPEPALNRAAALKAAHPDWIVTGAAHGPVDGIEALDAMVLSPVFAAGGASSVRSPLGLEGFSALAAKLGRPVYALGGINVENAASLLGCGACGIAGVDGIVAAFGP
ncbi:thiamine phosphate synthase [Rhizobium sp. CRIBSB]|nr:thiamine phosphate synthase [Rhizobium sp. CRIBSB]